MLTDKLMRLVIVGGSEWVMVLLLLLSVASIAVVIERALYYRRRRERLDQVDRKLSALIGAATPDRDKKIEKIRDMLDGEQDLALRAAIDGLDAPGRDRDAAEKIVRAALERERLALERRLSFLGTLGNNAPFIGLFGTVLGIIRAFHDLSQTGRPNTSVVMAGISEALVATAIGLFVALPAVLFYNYFQRSADRTLSITESLTQGILATLPPSHPPRPQPDEKVD